MSRAGLAIAFLVAAATGCSHPAPPSVPAARQPAVVLVPADGSGEVRVKVEVARTPSDQQRGMMYRDHFEPGWGMLFLFERAEQLKFWMHNCYIPIDMVFIRSDKRVLGVVERAPPMTDDSRYVDGESQFVLELPGGYAAAHHIGPGAPVTFIDVDPKETP